jgi:large subunit ribosomal protein L9e
LSPSRVREVSNIPPIDDNVNLRSRKSPLLTKSSRAGKLVKDLSHIAVTFTVGKNKAGKQLVQIEIHHGSRKNVATLRTVKSIIANLVIGVTKGYKYKMRYVYAHFPINVNIEKNDEDRFQLEIR